jgi:signal transduction histidine kinase
MRRPHPFPPCLLFLGILAGTAAFGQKTDSLRLRLVFLVGERKAHLLKDTDYLRAVDSIAPLLTREDSLPQWLFVYREVAFSDPKQGRRRANYYSWMALHAYLNSKFGSAVYYSEKNNEEKINAGIFERSTFSHGDLFALSVYYNNRDYTQVIAKYLPLQPAIAGVPAAIVKGKISPEAAWLALSILQTAVYTYRKTGDLRMMDSTYRLAAAIFSETKRSLTLNGKWQQEFDYVEESMAFETQRAHQRPLEAAGALAAAVKAVQAADFPANLRADYAQSLYNEAVEFYFERNKNDSARYYLGLLHGQQANALFAVSDPVALLMGDARLQAGSGQYAEAYHTMRKAFQLRDSAYYSVSSDRDNNLYALAEAENARADLLRTDEQKRAAERSNLILFFLLFLFLFGGAISFVLYRSRQHQRLLNLQLGLARNFHDSIGPMLIYANALVKKEMDEHQSPRLTALKDHIGLLMDEVRGISHDLKSDRFKTITGFGRELTATLEKLREATGIGFTLKVENGEKALTQLQLTHLSRIVHELVGNSIKHAGCGTINLEMTGVKRSLQVHYSDDGKGIDPDRQPAGIGLQNIRERVASLRGSFHLDNAWPRGYSILILIPLL